MSLFLRSITLLERDSSTGFFLGVFFWEFCEFFKSSPPGDCLERKDSLETPAVLLIFSLELEISGMVVQRRNQNSKKWWLLLSENDFEDALANFC